MRNEEQVYVVIYVRNDRSTRTWTCLALCVSDGKCENYVHQRKFLLGRLK
jgi:hypothetical protein